MNKPTFGTYRGWSIDTDNDPYLNKYIDDKHKVMGSLFFTKGSDRRAFLIKETFNPLVNYYDEDLNKDHYEHVGCSGEEYYEKHLQDNITEVHPQSLAMFTGAYNTEDKPLYCSIPLPDGSMSRGGDILKDAKEIYNVGEVMINPANPCGEKGPFVNWYIKSSKDYSPDTWFEGVIIGNAYENPELLECNNERN